MGTGMRIAACWAFFALSANASTPSASPETVQVPVTLFGQPCTLTGPLSEAALRALHSISPEQTPPARSAEPARNALGKVKKITHLPPALDRYREKLSRRLEAQVAFYDGLGIARKTNKLDKVYEAIKQHLPEARGKNVEAVARRFNGDGVVTNEIIDAFEEALEPMPEEEFHRAIQRLNVRYACSFEEADEE